MGGYGRSANGGRTLLARRSAAKDASHSAGGGPHGPLGTCRDLAAGGCRAWATANRRQVATPISLRDSSSFPGTTASRIRLSWS